MAISNLTAKQLKELDPKKLTSLVDDLHASMKVVDGKKVLPGKICTYWPLLRVLLIAAKTLTPEATDKKIDVVIAAGDLACGVA